MNSSPGAILLLLLAVYMLLAFFTGRLEWLFSMARDTSAGYRAGQTAPAATNPAVAPGLPSAPYAIRYPTRTPAYA